ncbi:DUF1360 domain-containing protein [Peribacillus sp. SCS-155]|uniref:DUF1360 domain-containing protein n=1 Tax=Peribacillus sedimenti TaxID=3115297 RepID=UPI003905B1B2
MNLATLDLTVIVLLGLASFRLTRLIVFDKITEFIRRPFFDEIEESDENGSTEIYLIPKKNGIRSWIGELLSCYWCTGIWVSLLLLGVHLLHSRTGDFLIIVLAIAAMGAIIETIIGKLLAE